MMVRNTIKKIRLEAYQISSLLQSSPKKSKNIKYSDMNVVERVGISSVFSLSFRPGQLMPIGCGFAVSYPRILSVPLPAFWKKGGMVIAVSPWYFVAWKNFFNVRSNFQEKDLCFLSLSNLSCRVSSFCRLDSRLSGKNLGINEHF